MDKKAGISNLNVQLHCLDDYSELEIIGTRKVVKNADRPSFMFPIFRCPKCKRNYTSLEICWDKQRVRLDGKELTNILPTNDKARFKHYKAQKTSKAAKLKAPNRIAIAKPTEPLDCFVYSKPNTPSICFKCGEGSLKKDIICFPTKKNKYQQASLRQCTNCSRYYVELGTYNSCKQHIRILNPEDLADLEASLAQRKEEKRIQRETAKKLRQAIAEKKKERLIREREAKILEMMKHLDEQKIEMDQRAEERRRALEVRKKNPIEDKTVKKPVPKIQHHGNNIEAKDFVVRRTAFKCRYNNHSLQNIVGVVKIIDKYGDVKEAKVTAGYCRECNTFFIMESVYQSLKMKGTPVCRVSDEKAYMTGTVFTNGMELAPESVLMQYGYTVSQEDELTSSRRRKILALMIDNGILTKNEVIGYLDFFVNQRKNQHRFEKAIEKWESDREFVESYRTGDYVQFGVNGIYRRY